MIRWLRRLLLGTVFALPFALVSFAFVQTPVQAQSGGWCAWTSLNGPNISGGLAGRRRRCNLSALPYHRLRSRDGYVGEGWNRVRVVPRLTRH